MKLIDLHKEWCESGYMFDVPVKYHNDFKMFRQIKIKHNPDKWSAYNPLRQTIVLLICCMKNEL